MATISLNGPDGAGKTTISQRLLACEELRLKYLYMGINLEAINLALPTSRIVRYMKKTEGSHVKGRSASGEAAIRSKGIVSGLRSVARISYYIAEEWHRQLLSLIFQMRGYTVLFDRHFLVDFSLEETARDKASLSRRFHRWTIARFYPAPGLVIFLDAPGQVLFDRKGEKSPEELERRRQSFLSLAPRFQRWVNIDATQPLETVYQQVYQTVRQFIRESQRLKK